MLVSARKHYRTVLADAPSPVSEGLALFGALLPRDTIRGLPLCLIEIYCFLSVLNEVHISLPEKAVVILSNSEHL